MAGIKEEKDIQRILDDIRKIGAPEEFIKESLALATSIYRRLEIDYPWLLKKYRGE